MCSDEVLTTQRFVKELPLASSFAVLLPQSTKARMHAPPLINLQEMPVEKGCWNIKML